MKTYYWLPIAALAAFAADCGTETGDTTETAVDTFYDGDFIIESVTPTCNAGATPNTVTFDATFSGWADSVELDIIETGDPAFNTNPSAVWNESHIFAPTDNIEYAQDGTTDHWAMTLTAIDDLNYVSGSTSVFECNYYNKEGDVFKSLGFKLTATPDTGMTDNATDCAIFGEKSATAFSGDGCECFEEFLTPPPANPCGDH